MMKELLSAAVTVLSLLLFFSLSSAALAGGHSGLKDAMQDPKKMEAFMDARLDHRTGLEGKEAELGQIVAGVVEDLDGKLDLSASSDEEFGRYILTAVKTLNHNQGYQHQFNDALVKLHLTAVSMAKDNGMYEELVANDTKTTRFMMERIGGAIKMTGREDYALKAIFEQTSCMFHLVDDVEWSSPTSVTYTSPFGRVLEARYWKPANEWVSSRASPRKKCTTITLFPVTWPTPTSWVSTWRCLHWAPTGKSPSAWLTRLTRLCGRLAAGCKNEQAPWPPAAGLAAV
jgi:hypothetical protein